MADRENIYAQFLATRGVSRRSAELLDEERRIERNSDETPSQPRTLPRSAQSPQPARL